MVLKQRMIARELDRKTKLFMKAWKFLKDEMYMLQSGHALVVRKILDDIGLFDATDLQDCTILHKVIPKLLPFLKAHPRAYLLKCLE